MDTATAVHCRAECLISLSNNYYNIIVVVNTIVELDKLLPITQVYFSQVYKVSDLNVFKGVCDNTAAVYRPFQL